MREMDTVVLTEDIPKAKLLRGDVGTVVLVHRTGQVYEIEFCALDGTPLEVVTVEKRMVRPVASNEIPHVRFLGA